jgi:glycosyltransferase involved in cell wall biosynthesis
MAFTVLNVAFPFVRVAKDTAGGAEHVLLALDHALVASGHRSMVLAPAASEVEGHLVEGLPVPHVINDEARRAAHSHYSETLDKVRLANVDLVHLHGIDFLDYLPGEGVPVVATMHLPLNLYPQEAFGLSRPGTHLVCVSQSQAQTRPSDRRVPPVIPNGVWLEDFYPDSRKEDYVVALGRLCPEKAFHLALDAASAAGVPLVLAGETYAYPAHQQYFREAIQPRLRSPHRFVGRLGGDAKRTLLARARALLVSSQIAETSSLVAMEALACGTPVIAFRSGALPEIVDHGRTGFLVNSLDEMADAIGRAADLDTALCRRLAEERFSAQRMTERYFELYRVAIEKGSVHHVTR